MSLEAAIEHPAHSIHSGPAAGVLAATAIARDAGFRRVVAWDMGGTSSDATVIDGSVPRTDETRIGQFPCYLPTIDIVSIGAGGGSIGSVDSSGLLRVGPRSAGADPGPACYGLGGTEPTLTDAYVALGMIPPGPIAGGRRVVNRALAVEALTKLAGVAHLKGPMELADAMVRIASSGMYGQMLPMMAKHGIDPKDFTLVAFGGAGGTHAFLLAKEVGFTKVLVPALPGMLCAWGCLIADLSVDFPATVHLELSSSSMPQLESALSTLETKARQWMHDQGVDLLGLSFEREGRLRYEGQAFELAVPITNELSPESVKTMADSFFNAHTTQYGFADPEGSIQIIDVVIRAKGERPKGKMQAGLRAAMGTREIDAQLQQHEVLYEGRTVRAKVMNRSALNYGDRVPGPAILLQTDTTVFIPDRFTVTVDADLNLIGEVS